MFDFGSDIKSKDKLKKQTLVFQTLDSAMYWINHCPAGTGCSNAGWHYPPGPSCSKAG